MANGAVMPPKIAQNSDDAWTLQETYEGAPHGWIQWQGTGVCMDIYCKCGVQTHIDDECIFLIKCGACGTVYHCNGHIELIEITTDPGDVPISTKE